MNALPITKLSLKRLPALAHGYRTGHNLIRCIRRKLAGTGNKVPPELRMISSSAYRNLFCGYYDHSPFQPGNDDVLLVHANNSPAWRVPSPSQVTSVLLFDWRDMKIIKSTGDTYAWNWQQGARALWLTRHSVAYNVFDRGTRSYRARVVDINSGGDDLLPIAVQEIDANGTAYGISYEALSAIRPDYGYRNKSCSHADIWENRIVAYSTNTGKTRELVNIEELQKDTDDQGVHLHSPSLNHLMASPSGEHLLFLFRYFLGDKRITDLYVIETATRRRRCLAHDKGVSHCCWMDSASLLATMQTPEHGFGYYRIPLASPSYELLWRHADGHPTPLSDHGFLTDTYPDRRGMRHLLSVTLSPHGQPQTLASFAEPLLFHGQTRCDLHPSLSASGRWIQVDMARHHHRVVGILPTPATAPQ